MTQPRQLSRQLRRESDPDLRRRRWVMALSNLGALAGRIVGLYQMGVIRRLPDPPGRVFDSSRVDASDYAYKRPQTPDRLLMTGICAVTAIRAGAGGRDRAREQPIAMAVKAFHDAAATIRLGREEWRDNRALCAYRQAATAASRVSAVLVFPEATHGVQTLLGRR